ncbi:MAG: hypothetical protein A2X49_05530 [Lentisphaerae bacterium GWF2_52_8]|nr:MAG: hypothetical protein A2X49_05530 [Lentisphaerae bacterium GWF2_52_8]
MKNLFVIGNFRSGTSLLGTALNAHPNLMVAYEPYLLFFKQCRNKFLAEVLGKPCDPDYPIGLLTLSAVDKDGCLERIFEEVRFSADELAKLVEILRPYLVHENNICKDSKPARLGKFLDGLKPGSAGEVLQQLMERFLLSEQDGIAKGKDLRMVGIKEVFCEEYMPAFLNSPTLGGAKVVHIIRDLRAVVASRNYGKYYETAGNKYPISFFIRSWKQTVEMCRRCQNIPGYMMIRYEDMVTHPEETFQNICDTLEIPFAKELTDFSSYTNSKGGQWKPNTSFERAKDITSTAVSRWRKILTPADIEVLEHFCRDEMAFMGYQPVTENFDLERIANYNEDEALINPWLRNYGFGYMGKEGVGKSVKR